MLIYNIGQLLTVAGAPQRGNTLGELTIIRNGAVLIRGEQIVQVGDSDTLKRQYEREPSLNVHGNVVLPGFVDPHTHAVWAGDRAREFEQRLQGKSYLEIMEEGGGIVSTVKATRKASLEELKSQTRNRLKRMFLNGSTTIEVKTGYGLDIKTELKMLKAALELNEEGPWELVLTFLGAHAIPEKYKGKSDKYVNFICKKALPAVFGFWAENAVNQPLPFVDVFCETGAFDLKQTRKILKTARALGFPLKVHSDEFDNLGGTSLAVEMGAASVDHLVATSEADIQALGSGETVAVSLPCTPFGLAEKEYTPAKAILDAGGCLAIATDLNPGTAWCENMQFAQALACRYLKLTPAQAIAASTINAAKAVGWDNKVGSIQAGKQADLLVLSVKDYRHLGYRFGGNLVETVIKKGQLFRAPEADCEGTR